MLGLLYKNLMGSKRETTLMLVLACAMVLFVATVGPRAFLPCVGGVVGLSIMAPAASLQLDKQSGWNRFICASPIPRNRVTLSLYLSAMLSNAFLLCLLLVARTLGKAAMPLWAFAVIFGFELILQSITLPVGLKLGQTAVVIIFLGTVFGFSGLSDLLARLGILTDPFIDSLAARFLAAPWISSLGVLAAALILYAASCFLTCRIYRKMEF